jgi:tetratricopeptide (TPR) repeat protein
MVSSGVACKNALALFTHAQSSADIRKAIGEQEIAVLAYKKAQAHGKLAEATATLGIMYERLGNHTYTAELYDQAVAMAANIGDKGFIGADNSYRERCFWGPSGIKLSRCAWGAPLAGGVVWRSASQAMCAKAMPRAADPPWAHIQYVRKTQPLLRDWRF